MTTASAGVTGGYDVPFVDPLDKDFECPICLLAVRDPVQTPCGHSFCKTCFNQVAGTQQWDRARGDVECPIDKQRIPLSEVFNDVKVKRKVLSLSVKCQNEIPPPAGEKDQGEVCSWVGALSDYEHHLSKCKYQTVTCDNDCGMAIQRCQLHYHKRSVCDRRIVMCIFCRDPYEQRRLQAHLTDCPKVPVLCPLECGMTVDRENVYYHVNESGDCPNALINCPFKETGCDIMCKRCELRDHLTTSVVEHQIKQQQMIIKQQQMMKRLSDENAGLKRRLAIADNSVACLTVSNAELKQRLALVDSSVTCLSSNVGHLLMLPSQCTLLSRGRVTIRFRVPFKGCDRILKSSSFLIYHTGYKAKVVVDRNVNGDDKAMCIAICPTSGDRDDQLSWPFKICHTITMINQRDHRINRSWTIDPAKLDADLVNKYFCNPNDRHDIIDRLYLKDIGLIVQYSYLFSHGFVKDGIFFVTVEVDDNWYTLSGATLSAV